MKPMLATIGNENILDKKGYLFEVKLDGIRALCYKKTKLKFTSRNGIIITNKYPEFNFFKDLKAKECILDGEIVVFDEKGRPSFEKWGEHQKSKTKDAKYIAFDILYYNGKSLLKEPLYKRKKILDKVVKEGDNLMLSAYTEDGKKLWRFVKENKLEGVIAKKSDSSYVLGERSSDWIKIKITKEVDCVILGYTTEKRTLTSLALGFYNKDNLVYAGKAGTGFNERSMKELKEKLEKIKLKKELIETESGVIPVKPILVAEVTCHEVTKNGKLRAPVFKRLREDKNPEECVLPNSQD